MVCGGCSFPCVVVCCSVLRCVVALWCADSVRTVCARPSPKFGVQKEGEGGGGEFSISEAIYYYFFVCADARERKSERVEVRVCVCRFVCVGSCVCEREKLGEWM